MAFCGPQLSSCRYLRACIDESLRMSPPVPGTLWRSLFAEEEIGGPLIVDGHVIPPGSQVGVNIYSIHHNKDYFPDPWTFRPERWLDEDKVSPKVMQSAFTPFSVGSRGCAGKAMAYLEASLTMAKTLWFFDFERASGELGELGARKISSSTQSNEQDEFWLYDVVTSTHDGPYLIFLPREDVSREVEVETPVTKEI